jgi:hypothetical protein
MDVLKGLREQARKKRDQAIHAARREYSNNLRDIAQLGLRLNMDVRSKRGTLRKSTIYSLIIEHMPKDRPFALRDVLPILMKAEPDRRFIEDSVRTTFKRLIDDGKVRKVRKSDHGYMLWAAPDYPIDELGPLATVSMADAIEHVLRQQGPMRPVEIVLAVQKLGYRADASPRALLLTLGQALKRHSGRRFALLTNGKWSAV